jgi:hypothetical protein
LRLLSDWVYAVMIGPQVVELALVDERRASIQAEARAAGELEPSRDAHSAGS